MIGEFVVSVWVLGFGGLGGFEEEQGFWCLEAEAMEKKNMLRCCTQAREKARAKFSIEIISYIMRGKVYGLNSKLLFTEFGIFKLHS